MRAVTASARTATASKHNPSLQTGAQGHGPRLHALRLGETILGKHCLPFRGKHKIQKFLPHLGILAGGGNGNGVAHGVVAFHNHDHFNLVRQLLGIGAVNKTGINLAAGHIVQHLISWGCTASHNLAVFSASLV